MTPKDEWPQWLRDAKTANAVVDIVDGLVIWRGGVWYDGRWCGGIWRGGEWRDDRFDRLLFMAAGLGIIFDTDRYAVAYRSTAADYRGRYNGAFVQISGRVDVEHEPAGCGTCVAGLHVTSAQSAMTYFGVDLTAKLWRVRFHRDDLLDCDGEKARLRGGWCEEIAWPFLGEKARKANLR